ncbi:SHQ1-domain-containing protein [Rickenella mellea]|uniref:SHQ1-domain-containing protein n=1 Tax=Rickenella mellea TaxID=50990 RepID=A0A4Y7QL57_9AGAM|nr:SHQ1-domain-containing protein [Rickenella mellea]
MITPTFSCSQSTTSVTVNIYVPAVRASDVEIHVDGTLLSVHVNPYFLRLTLPGRVLEDDASDAEYDPSSGYLKVTLTKEESGEEFKGLDILAQLLAPQKQKPSSPLIEAVSSDDADSELARTTENMTMDDTDKELLEGKSPLHNTNLNYIAAAENDWQLPQEVPSPLPILTTTAERRYGFLNMHSGYFRHVTYTENDVNELGPDAETLREEERRIKRMRREEDKWDEEHYMQVWADFADDEWIQQLIDYKFPVTAPGSPDVNSSLKFTDEENLIMLRLPRKEYLSTAEQLHSLYLTLVTILFSYAYDVRTTQHDPTPESAWTISVLTPAFTALDRPPYLSLVASTFTSPNSVRFAPDILKDTLIPSLRRSLAFPLYRSWTLAMKCILDVSRMFAGGKHGVLRGMLAVKRILDSHDMYYVYSKIWVDDFCAWVARDASDEDLKFIGQSLRVLHLDKSCVGWDLEALENAVRAQLAQPSDSDDESTDTDA